ncbi:hypothetical protein [Petrimonas sulfuriphila]|uniref:hypothetical protein n=1 Tax=Petrimonas sulfuriphila TaxID=285070 RepID=UPI003EBD5F3D
MKTAVRFSLILIVAILLALFVNVRISDFFMATIFNVSGIMFSLGLGLIVSFNINGVKNKQFIASIRRNLCQVRNSFIKYFSIAVVCYILDEVVKSQDLEALAFSLGNRIFSLNWSLFFATIMFYSIIYFIFNFLQVQKLNNDIFDELNK